jgi:hypothetical protein
VHIHAVAELFSTFSEALDWRVQGRSVGFAKIPNAPFREATLLCRLLPAALFLIFYPLGFLCVTGTGRTLFLAPPTIVRGDGVFGCRVLSFPHFSGSLPRHAGIYFTLGIMPL